MNISVDSLRQALCDGGKILSYKGLNEGFGHISTRIPGEEKCLITTRDALAFVQPHEIEEVEQMQAHLWWLSGICSTSSIS